MLFTSSYWKKTLVNFKTKIYDLFCAGKLIQLCSSSLLVYYYIKICVYVLKLLYHLYSFERRHESIWFEKKTWRSLIKTKESWIFQILRLLFYFTLQRGLNLHTRMHLTNEPTKNEALPSINLLMLRWLGSQQINQHNLEFRTFFTCHRICENGKSCNFICVRPLCDSRNS